MRGLKEAKNNDAACWNCINSMAAQGKRRTIVARDPWRELEELQELIVNPEDIGEPLANPEFPDRKLLHKGVLSRILPTQVVEGWSEDKISDDNFLNMIENLVKRKIIII